MPILMTLGAVLFLAGAMTFLVLLFSSGGAQRSRQFAVLGQLRSGALGTARRRLLMVSIGLIGTGAVACFAGVGAMDAARAARCHEYCVARDFSNGSIGPSVDRSTAGRFVACTCTAPDQPTLELRADAIPR